MTAVGDPPRPAMGTRPALGQFFRAATTPAKLRLLLADLVLLCLIWGAVAAWVVSQRASGANDVVGASEPLSLDGQQIYRALSDADATAAARRPASARCSVVAGSVRRSRHPRQRITRADP